jgi:hypothetical protein
MCFSSTASFAAGGVLSVAGLVALKNVSGPRQYMFASVPLVFAAQQLAEGFLWQSFNSLLPGGHDPWMYAFLFVAQVLWPSWVPTCLYIMEKDRFRRGMLFYFCLTGWYCSLVLGWKLLSATVSVDVSNHHVLYETSSKGLLAAVANVLYLVATLVPLFVSSVRKSLFTGVTLLVSAAVAYSVYRVFFISIWCFFAALLSVLVIVVIRAENRAIAQ